MHEILSTSKTKKAENSQKNVNFLIFDGINIFLLFQYKFTDTSQ